MCIKGIFFVIFPGLLSKWLLTHMTSTEQITKKLYHRASQNYVPKRPLELQFPRGVIPIRSISWDLIKSFGNLFNHCWLGEMEGFWDLLRKSCPWLAEYPRKERSCEPTISFLQPSLIWGYIEISHFKFDHWCFALVYSPNRFIYALHLWDIPVFWSFPDILEMAHTRQQKRA